MMRRRKGGRTHALRSNYSNVLSDQHSSRALAAECGSNIRSSSAGQALRSDAHSKVVVLTRFIRRISRQYNFTYHGDSPRGEVTPAYAEMLSTTSPTERLVRATPPTLNFPLPSSRPRSFPPQVSLQQVSARARRSSTHLLNDVSVVFAPGALTLVLSGPGGGEWPAGGSLCRG
jgi:hypothetical protein